MKILKFGDNKEIIILIFIHNIRIHHQMVILRQKTQILSPISGSSVILVNFIDYLLIK